MKGGTRGLDVRPGLLVTSRIALSIRACTARAHEDDPPFGGTTSGRGTVAATRVDADELIAQFVGVHDDQGGWETQPVPSPNLIHAICAQLRPASREALREQLYLLEPDHELSYREQLAVNVGFRRWRRDRRRRRHLGLL